MGICINCDGEIFDDDCYCKICGLNQRCLTSEDNEKICKYDLAIINPGIVIELSNNLISKTIDRFPKAPGKKGIEIGEIVFCIYCFAFALKRFSKKKKAREESINKQIDNAYIRLTVRTLSKQKITEEAENSIISIIKKKYAKLDIALDSILKSLENSEEPDYSAIIRIGEIIYEDKIDADNSWGLYSFIMPLITELIDVNRKCMVVEDEDFKLEYVDLP